MPTVIDLLCTIDFVMVQGSRSLDELRTLLALAIQPGGLRRECQEIVGESLRCCVANRDYTGPQFRPPPQQPPSTRDSGEMKKRQSLIPGA